MVVVLGVWERQDGWWCWCVGAEGCFGVDLVRDGGWEWGCERWFFFFFFLGVLGGIIRYTPIFFLSHLYITLVAFSPFSFLFLNPPSHHLNKQRLEEIK